MTDGQGAIKEVVDATTPIAEAAARETWPYKKLLLAVLPPTLALFSVVVGVWDNGRRDRVAAEQAEDKRQDTLEQARADALERERVRAEEAAKDLRLRRSELVLPKYEQLLVDIHAVSDPINHCIDVFNGFLDTIASDGHLSIMGEEPILSDLGLLNFEPEIEALRAVGVDSEVVETCSKISGGVDNLSLSLDQARLVSDGALETSAKALEAALAESSDGAEALLRYVHNVNDLPPRTPPPFLFGSATGEWYIMIDLRNTSTEDGTPLARTAAELNTSIFAIPGLADEVISEARSQILQSDE